MSLCTGKNISFKKTWLASMNTKALMFITSEYCTLSGTEEAGHRKSAVVPKSLKPISSPSGNDNLL
jgi:hypothetical protein